MEKEKQIFRVSREEFVRRVGQGSGHYYDAMIQNGIIPVDENKLEKYMDASLLGVMAQRLLLEPKKSDFEKFVQLVGASDKVTVVIEKRNGKLDVTWKVEGLTIEE